MPLPQLTALDYLFLGVILTSTGFALTKGLAREVISLVALVAGFVLASLYYPRVADLVADLARTEAVAYLIGFLVVFLGTIALGALVAFVVNRFVKMAALEWFDRLLGGLYGFLRGWAVASILVMALVAFPVRHEAVSRSYLAPYLLAGARAASVMVPRDLKDRFRAEYKKVLDAWSTHRSST
jgi:membrane protein required for colicin V production